MKNSADQGGCYPPRPSSSVDNRILHILRKPNSIIALLFIQNISSFLKEFSHYALCFPLTKYNTTLSPGFLGQRFNNLRRAVLLTSLIQYGEDFDVIGSIIIGRLHFWRHWFNMAKILSKFGEQQLVMVNYACGLNQSGTGKYFEWIINIITLLNPLPVPIILLNPLPFLVALKILREILSFTRWFMINTRPLVGCLET